MYLDVLRYTTTIEHNTITTFKNMTQEIQRSFKLTVFFWPESTDFEGWYHANNNVFFPQRNKGVFTYREKNTHPARSFLKLEDKEFMSIQ